MQLHMIINMKEGVTMTELKVRECNRFEDIKHIAPRKVHRVRKLPIEPIIKWGKKSVLP